MQRRSNVTYQLMLSICFVFFTGEGCPTVNQILHKGLRHSLFTSINARYSITFVLFIHTLRAISPEYGVCGQPGDRCDWIHEK